MWNAASTWGRLRSAVRFGAIAFLVVALSPAVAAPNKGGNGFAGNGPKGPETPTNLQVVGASSSSVSLAWAASARAVGYDIYRNDVLAGTTGATGFLLGGLACGTTYAAGVEAFDSAGRRSERASISAGTSACASSPPPPAGSGYTFLPDADAKVYEEAPGTSYGSATNVRTDGGSDPDVESFLRFTVKGLSGSVQRATLRLYAYTDTVDGPSVYPATGAWSESTITWNNRPAPTGPAGADSGAIKANTWVELDATRLVGGEGTYTFRLATGSTDGVDFRSRESAGLEPQLVVTTGSSTGDTSPPTAPTGLKVTGASETGISLSWGASVDNVGVAGYGVYVNGGLVGSASTTAYALSGLACGTVYTLQVDAFDAALNRSARAGISASTAACSQPPTGLWPANPYPAGSIWNPTQAIASGVAVDPSSSALVSALMSQLGTPLLTLRRYATAVAVVTGGETMYTIPCTKYSCNVSRWGQIPVPSGTKPDPGGDGHLAVLDYANRREWGFWQAVYSSTTNSWSTSSGHALLFSERAAPSSVAGLNDANFPGVAGIVTPEELAAGDIRHPLVFQTPARGSGSPRCPATVNSGSGSSGIVNGMWFQLDPSVNVESLGLKRWEKTIAKALQRYGMFVRDGSSGTTDVVGENPVNRGSSTWNLVRNDDGSQAFSSTANYGYFSSSFPWAKLRALAPPC